MENVFKTIKLSEFKAYVDETMKSTDVEELELLKANIAIVNELKKENEEIDENMSIVITVKKAKDASETVQNKIDELKAQENKDENTDEEKSDEETADENPETDDNKDDENKEDKDNKDKDDKAAPESQTMALEAIDALIKKYEDLKTVIASDNVTKEDIESIWQNDYSLKEVLEQTLTIMEVSKNLVTVLESVVPVLKEEAGVVDEKKDFIWKASDLAGASKGAEEEYKNSTKEKKS